MGRGQFKDHIYPQADSIMKYLLCDSVLLILQTYLTDLKKKLSNIYSAIRRSMPHSVRENSKLDRFAMVRR